MKWIYAGLAALIILGGGLTELWYFNKQFSALENEARAIYAAMETDTEHIDSAQNIVALDSFMDRWRRAENNFQLGLSQLVINDLSYRIVSMDAHIRKNNYEVAHADTLIVLDNLKLMERLYQPRFRNMF